ncbi:carbohydrate kinase family protein [Geopsychrobacter electrodiphilus]|uniref:carbohydrate kinase family protein n=1 Tax=Geopsychrobacter electrodiphilus TaxID=225196 RepID=UPI000369955D|nr:carbohydrate kinase [Geopsychrobacter electrodiphilus]
MSRSSGLTVFGEVLFDCFPSGEQILGGAPFNVAWHLQALGNRPQFISRVGDDELGKTILAAMQTWGMSTTGVQFDPVHPTGQVAVKVVGNEPSYTILQDSAYDFVDAAKIGPAASDGVLYHGTLGLRNSVSRDAFQWLVQAADLKIFLDVNLRTPWWQQAEVHNWLAQAHWVKLNLDELRLLGFDSLDIHQEMARFQVEFQLEQLILTRGEAGALVRTAQGEYHEVVPKQAPLLVDTVGAGDAFSAVYIHGLLAGWSITKTLQVAQQFASKIIGLRGATTKDASFYQEIID